MSLMNKVGRFVFLLILLLTAVGCGSADEVGSAVIKTIPEDKVDEFVTAARRVLGKVDGELTAVFQGSGGEAATTMKDRLRPLVLDAGCGAIIDTLKEGSFTWEIARENATEAIAGSVATNVGLAELVDAYTILNSMMEAIQEESQGDPLAAQRICSRIE
jgi:hypothetical protein